MAQVFINVFFTLVKYFFLDKKQNWILYIIYRRNYASIKKTSRKSPGKKDNKEVIHKTIGVRQATPFADRIYFFSSHYTLLIFDFSY
jgi:hypothetical protein